MNKNLIDIFFEITEEIDQNELASIHKYNLEDAINNSYFENKASNPEIAEYFTMQ